MRALLVAVLLVALVGAAGCSAPVRSGTCTLASTSLGADQLGQEFVLVKKNAEGSASTPIILFPFGYPRDYKVMEKMLAENGGDVLTNVRFTSKSTVFLLFGAVKLTVTGDIWKRAGSADAQLESLPLGEIGDIAYTRDSRETAPEGGTSR